MVLGIVASVDYGRSCRLHLVVGGWRDHISENEQKKGIVTMKLLLGLVLYVAGSVWLACHLRKKRLELETKNQRMRDVLGLEELCGMAEYWTRENGA